MKMNKKIKAVIEWSLEDQWKRKEFLAYDAAEAMTDDVRNEPDFDWLYEVFFQGTEGTEEWGLFELAQTYVRNHKDLNKKELLSLLDREYVKSL